MNTCPDRRRISEMLDQGGQWFIHIDNDKVLHIAHQGDNMGGHNDQAN